VTGACCLYTAALGGPGKPSFTSDIYDFKTTGEKAPGESGPGWAVTAVDVKSQSVEILLDGITDGHVHVRVTGSKTTVRTKGPVITIDAKLGGFASTEGKLVTVKGTLTCQQP
jgi:hypothetical protein